MLIKHKLIDYSQVEIVFGDDDDPGFHFGPDGKEGWFPCQYS